MKIGLISDTHNKLPAAVFEVFKDVQQIIHAGDIGSEDIINDLSAIAPVKAVYGNMDTFPVVSRYNRIDFFKLAGRTICLTHIIGKPENFAYQLFKMNKKADIVISGHTHQYEHKIYNNIHFINPGSASMPKYTKNGTVAILEISDKAVEVELIHLEE